MSLKLSSVSTSISGWPLRRKLALVLALPMLLAATFGGLRVLNEARSSADHTAAASQVTVLPPAVDYLNAAEDAAVIARHKTEAVDPKRDAAVKEVQQAAQELSDAADAADLTPTQREQMDSILSLSSQLRNGEAYVSAGQSVSQVRQLHQGITQLISQIVSEQTEPEPLLLVLVQALDGRLSLSMQQFQVAYGNGSDANPVDLAAELGVEAAAIDRLGASLGSDDPQVIGLNQANAQRFGVVRAGGFDLGGMDVYAPYDELSTGLLADIDGNLTAAAGSARNSAIVSAVVTGLALLVAALLALMVAGTLLRPIRRVRDGALHVAREELPETVARIRAGEDPGEITPIDITTEEEMGQLARAFDDLHRQAISLASGEAGLRSQVGEMFATLSRRNTTLINQQLGLIEDLERDEEDPRRLESLFRLDHLASRMRRTAESLMVLADAPTPGGDGVDLNLGDLLQAAIAGVRDYQRVQILVTPDGRISGLAAPDVVHLMTELVDNALSYSPPTAPVLIKSRRIETGIEIEIVDDGLGIETADLARLNTELASGGEVTPETARRMGLLVVSRLARRRGIQVYLRLNEGAGVTAHVVLPFALLGEDVAVPTPQPWASIEAPVRTPAAAYGAGPAAVVAPSTVPAAQSTQSGDDNDSTAHYLAAINAVTRLPQRQPAPVSEPEPEPDYRPAPVAVAAEPAPIPAAVPPATPTATPTAIPAVVPSSSEEMTPIFATLRSNWFSSNDRSQAWTSNEIEAGWVAAHKAAEAPRDTLGATGLPVRRPGQRLVPGGVTAAAPPVARDPEAIRKRLAAHAAGVSRGRSTTVKPPTDLPQKEADPA